MGKSRAPEIDEKAQPIRGLLDYISQTHLQVDAEQIGLDAIIAAAKKRIHQLDQEIERLRPEYEKSKPKVGKPLGRWFDEGRAYSVWLLAHTLWARQNGWDGVVDFQRPKKASTRDLIALAKKTGWDLLPVRPGGANLFLGEMATLEQSISRGRKKLNIGKDWQSAACEEIFRKLLEYRANDKPS
jgi:hypothetical protein